MGIFEAIILGVVQGATEYLPVSSSGHLVLVPFLFGFQKAPFAFDVLVQMGTLLGVLIFYARRLWDVLKHVLLGLKAGTPFKTQQARFGWLVLVATIPAAVLGLLFKSTFEETFASPRAAGGFLLLTAALLVIAEFISSRATRSEHLAKEAEANGGEATGKKRSERDLNLLDAVVIGCFQALALFPGVSRSGSTIAGGLLRGLDRTSATNFSFVMSIPVMLGAGILTLKDLLNNPAQLEALAVPIAVGFVVSAVTGYYVIKKFLGFVQRRGLVPFAIYCVFVGTLVLILAPSAPDVGELTQTSAPELPAD